MSLDEIACYVPVLLVRRPGPTWLSHVASSSFWPSKVEEVYAASRNGPWSHWWNSETVAMSWNVLPKVGESLEALQ